MGALSAKEAGQAEARKEVRLGDADARVLCDQLFLALTHIGAALQQLRRQAGRDRGGTSLFGELRAARDGPGGAPQQDAEPVLRVGDAPLELGEDRKSVV